MTAIGEIAQQTNTSPETLVVRLLAQNTRTGAVTVMTAR
jgi:hypothetical protein